MQTVAFSSLQNGSSETISLQAPANSRDTLRFQLDRDVADAILLPHITTGAAMSTTEDHHFSCVLTEESATVECSREVAWIILRAVRRITQNPQAPVALVTHAATDMMRVQSLLLAKR